MFLDDPDEDHEPKRIGLITLTCSQVLLDLSKVTFPPPHTLVGGEVVTGNNSTVPCFLFVYPNVKMAKCCIDHTIGCASTQKKTLHSTILPPLLLEQKEKFLNEITV